MGTRLGPSIDTFRSRSNYELSKIDGGNSSPKLIDLKNLYKIRESQKPKFLKHDDYQNSLNKNNRSILHSGETKKRLSKDSMPEDLRRSSRVRGPPIQNIKMMSELSDSYSRKFAL